MLKIEKLMTGNYFIRIIGTHSKSVKLRLNYTTADPFSAIELKPRSQ